MARNRPVAFLGGAALLAFVTSSTGGAKSQVNCETVPAGPARTDCYIGLSRINRQKSEIAAGVAQQQGKLSPIDRRAFQNKMASCAVR
jgi:hypothetical protein